MNLWICEYFQALFSRKVGGFVQVVSRPLTASIIWICVIANDSRSISSLLTVHVMVTTYFWNFAGDTAAYVHQTSPFVIITYSSCYVPCQFVNADWCSWNAKDQRLPWHAVKISNITSSSSCRVAKNKLNHSLPYPRIELLFNIPHTNPMSFKVGNYFILSRNRQVVVSSSPFNIKSRLDVWEKRLSRINVLLDYHCLW